MEIADTVTKFVSLWQEGDDKHLEAAKIYYQAVKENNEPLKAAIRNHPMCCMWSSRKWNILMQIGGGALHQSYLNAHKYIVPDTMIERHVITDEQFKVYKEGLPIWNGNKEVVIPFKNITKKNILQAFDADGKRRTMEEQKKYLNALRRKSKHLMFHFDKKCIVVDRRCVIDKESFFQEIMLHSAGFVNSKDLYGLASFIQQQERQNKGARK